ALGPSPLPASRERDGERDCEAESRVESVCVSVRFMAGSGALLITAVEPEPEAEGTGDIGAGSALTDGIEDDWVPGTEVDEVSIGLTSLVLDCDLLLPFSMTP